MGSGCPAASSFVCWDKGRCGSVLCTGCQSSVVSSDATTRWDLNHIGVWGVCGCGDSSRHLMTLGVDSYWSVIWQCWDRAYSVLLVIHFLLSLFHLLVLLRKTLKVVPIGFQTSLCLWNISLEASAHWRSPGLRPYQGKGVAR